ncbi:hypothetical protein [Streptomyces qinglanensis]|uniref:hypothetical protein n=1 Tax=Streptomyces qinglanensis TaxID=943816 RepID=UPI003D71A433
MKPSDEIQRVHDHYDALGRALADEFNHRGVHGGGWQHKAGRSIDGNVTLSHPDGLGFSLVRMHTYRKGAAGRRLTISGVYPGCWGGSRAASITVDKDRRVSEIACEIVRRLLPDYMPTWREAMEELRIAEERRRARVVMNRRMEAMLPGLGPAGGTPPEEDPDRTHSFWSGGRHALEDRPVMAGGSATLRLDAQSIDLKLSDVPAELALSILRMLVPDNALQGVVMDRTPPTPPDSLPPPRRVIRGELRSATTDTESDRQP